MNNLLKLPATGVTPLSTLDAVEVAKRKRLEKEISEGLQTYIGVGNALLVIRDERLYRDEYTSFAEYCRERWGISKTHANRLIASSETITVISSVGPVPASEGAVRPLTLLPPAEQKEIWARVVKQVEDPTSLTANQVTRLINDTVNKPRSDKGAARPRKPGRPSLDMVSRPQVLNTIDSWRIKHEKSFKRMSPETVFATVRDLIAKL